MPARFPPSSSAKASGKSLLNRSRLISYKLTQMQPCKSTSSKCGWQLVITCPVTKSPDGHPQSLNKAANTMHATIVSTQWNETAGISSLVNYILYGAPERRAFYVHSVCNYITHANYPCTIWKKLQHLPLHWNPCLPKPLQHTGTDYNVKMTITNKPHTVFSLKRSRP